MERSLQDKLKKVYKDHTIKRDIFGKREALPSEIKTVLSTRDEENFAALEPLYSPSDEDISIKETPSKFTPRGSTPE